MGDLQTQKQAQDEKQYLDMQQDFVEKKKFDYNLPGQLKSYIESKAASKESVFAKNFLTDTFAKQNETYRKSDQYKADQEKLKQFKIGKNDVSYRERVDTEHRTASLQYSKVAADSKTFVKIMSLGIGGDSKSMEEIKKRLNIVQRLITDNMEGFKNKEGIYDGERFMVVITEAFESAIEACNNYTETHRKAPLTVWGKRRLSQVTEIRNQLQSDLKTYKDLSDVLDQYAFTDSDKDVLSPLDLLERVDFVEIEDVEHQEEGNSTEVYKGKLQEEIVTEENGKEVKKTEKNEYYIKENLALLHQDMDGFLARRLSELNTSLAIKKENAGNGGDRGPAVERKQKVEELRMRQARADETDYQNGLDLLKLMQDKISQASANEKTNIRRSFSLFFKHDFDRLFASLLEHNNAIEILNSGATKTLAQWKKESDDGDPTAKVVYAILLKEGVKDGAPKKTYQKKTPADWVIEHLNIKDKDIIRLMRRMDTQDINENMVRTGNENNLINQGANEKLQMSRIEALFRITMGKEVELYGQVMEKDQLESSQMSQYNTLATSYVADKYGFKDEVVSTKIKASRFKRWTGEMSEKTVTLQNVAEGMEWIELIKKAKEDNREIKLSPKAVQQLMRLQLFDTLCQQKDRHGRNFKCQWSYRDGGYCVDSIMAYDHDQSFSSVGLKESFNEKRGKDNKLISSEFNRFLAPMQQVIKKDSPKYKYIVNKYFKMNSVDPEWMTHQQRLPLKDIKKDNPREEHEIELSPMGKDWLLTCMYGKQLIDEGRGKNKKVPFVKGATTVKPMNVSKEESYIWDEEFKGGIVMKDADSRLRRKGTSRTHRSNNGSLDDFFIEEGEIKISSEEAKQVIDKLQDITDVLGDFFLKDIKNVDINTLNKNVYSGTGQVYNVDVYFKKPADLVKDKEKLKTAARAVKELKELSEKYDFSDVVLQNKGMVYLNTKAYKVNTNGNNFFFSVGYSGDYKFTGVLQAWINETLYMFSQSFANNETVKEVMQEADQGQEIPEDFKFLQNENGDLVIPNMLHMDLAAYRSLQDIVRDFKEKTLRFELKKKHLTAPAIQALYDRAKEMLREIDEEVRPAAEKFLNRMYPEGDPRRKFFLEKPEDYKQFTSLDEFAIDPGDTYLVQDNKQFLACKEDYAKFLTEKEKENILIERNKVLTDPKRWKSVADGELKTQISSSIVH